MKEFSKEYLSDLVNDMFCGIADEILATAHEITELQKEIETDTKMDKAVLLAKGASLLMARDRYMRLYETVEPAFEFMIQIDPESKEFIDAVKNMQTNLKKAFDLEEETE